MIGSATLLLDKIAPVSIGGEVYLAPSPSESFSIFIEGVQFHGTPEQFERLSGMLMDASIRARAKRAEMLTEPMSV
jgi:hypothetical protein